MKRIGLFFHPELPRAEALAAKLDGELDAAGMPHWVCSAWDEKCLRRQMPGTDLLVTLGGDGTVLQAARESQPDGVPILAARMGRVSFLADVEPEEVRSKLDAFQEGEGWTEERMMLSVTVESSGEEQHALNDAVVSRGLKPRVVHVRASIDGEFFTTFVSDGVILATPTGSTGYAMAVGGPLVHPAVPAIVLASIAPHLSLAHALVLPSSAHLELQVSTDHDASMTIDGRVDTPLKDSDKIHVRRSDRVTRFLRFGARSKYYAVLSQRLMCKE